MQQHPSEQELWAQLMAARAWRGLIGRYALLHWTDHAQLVRMCMMALEHIEPKHFRWYQEIASSAPSSARWLAAACGLVMPFRVTLGIEMLFWRHLRPGTGICDP